MSLAVWGKQHRATQQGESRALQGQYSWVPTAHSAHTAFRLLKDLRSGGSRGPTPCSSPTGHLRLSALYCCSEQGLETTTTGQAAHRALPMWQPWFPSNTSAAALGHCYSCHCKPGCKMQRLGARFGSYEPHVSSSRDSLVMLSVGNRKENDSNVQTG